MSSKNCKKVAIEREKEKANEKNKEIRKLKGNEIYTDLGKDKDNENTKSIMYEFLPNFSYIFSKKNDSIIPFSWAVEQILESRSTVFSQPTGYVLNSR